MVKIGEIKVSVQELGLKQGFFWTEIWIISLQGGLGPTILKVMPISICSPKCMGKKHQYELWARPAGLFFTVETLKMGQNIVFLFTF